MKRLGALGVMLLIVFSFTGCMHSVRLNKRAIVQAMAVDYEDDMYIVTMQLYGTQSESMDSTQTDVIEARGKTLTELLVSGSITQGKQLFIGGMRLVLFGESIAREGIGETLRFLNSSPQIQPTLMMAVTSGDAGAILREGKKNPTFTAASILNMLVSAQRSGYSLSGTLVDMVGALESGYGAVSGILPLIAIDEKFDQNDKNMEEGNAGGDPLLEELLKQESGETIDSGADEVGIENAKQDEKTEKNMTLAGGVLFNQDKMGQILSREEARGLCWLGKSADTVAVTVEGPGFERASVVSNQISSRIMPEPIADNIVFHIKVNVRGALLETKVVTGMEDMEIKAITALQEKQIRLGIERALMVTSRNGFDPLGLARLVRQRNPEYFAEHAKDWGTVMENAGFQIEVQCSIERKGAQRS